MRFLFTLLVFVSSQVLAGDWSDAPEWKFSQSLDSIAFRCDMQADFDRQQRQYGARPSGAELTECIGSGAKTAQDKFKEIAATTMMKSEVKAVYSKWLSYFTSISPYGRPNTDAKNAFKDASNDLKVALQMR